MPTYNVAPLLLIKEKKNLIQRFHEKLTRNKREKAKQNHHSKRSPQWCGITIHVAENCPYSCTYCYITEMGFQFDSPSPSPLSGNQLVFSLLHNRSFLPGRGGTLIAMGSVSDPFLLPEKTLNYLDALTSLGNPVQFSTKSYISENLARRIKEVSEENKSGVSPLVTIVSFSYASKLEPNAPTPEQRLKTIENLANADLQPVLFLRPVIPGVNDEEAKLIMKRAKKAGAKGVVVGSFRVTKAISTRLEGMGIPLVEVKKRVQHKLDARQRSVPLYEREKLLKEARNIGLIPWRTTCCANSFQSSVPCPSACFLGKFCTNCPNGCSISDHVPPKDEVEKALTFLRIRGNVQKRKVIVYSSGTRVPKMLVRNLSRRVVEVSHRNI
ncbi:MAG: radical SAM protein [Candidatus Korarchaeota archaeon]|nr:radical SAM protein [Candidatus Korarchaeota archaeon]NIU85654.1 radical SAM protein [Candidatus Thorarchaeota archaeon]NIW15755.1 radical SAM protein [Candidatus Thorarchaeota archaeon]NIW53671.1 radical SAM protein [Candidatus Korarchaeota archaeon]